MIKELKRQSIFRLSVIVLFLSFCWSIDSLTLEKTIEITSDRDLEGGVWTIPNGVTLDMKGGVIKNGTVVGSRTKIKYSGAVFNDVRILGTWNVPLIKTSMFTDLDDVNSLKNVVALANPEIHNKIVILPGIYKVSVQKEGDVCMSICGNTEIVIDGTIKLMPNKFKRFDILLLKGDCIDVRGYGSIIGDKHTHLGKSGEWGMGVRFDGATQSSLKGITIKDCWGDCVYVGGNSRNVLIESCYLNHGRRQGISVTKANGVIIRRCLITNVCGTNPQYAIDLEPNRGDTVTNVLIEKVTVKDCEGGFLATRSSNLENNDPVSWLGNIEIKGCNVAIKSKIPIYLRKSESATVMGCVVRATNAKPAIYTDDAKVVTVKNNTIYLDTNILNTIKNSMKKIAGKQSGDPISIVHAESKVVENNKVINN